MQITLDNGDINTETGGQVPGLFKRLRLEYLELSA